jgi:hypothetical protein
VEEIRRTVYVGNILKGTPGEETMNFFNDHIGEVWGDFVALWEAEGGTGVNRLWSCTRNFSAASRSSLDRISSTGDCLVKYLRLD